jgi:hypothetical protein
MPLHISIDQGVWGIGGVDWIARKKLAYQDPQMTPVRKDQILPATKYNLLVTGFNISMLLLIGAIVSAVLFAYTAAFVLGAIALFTRSITVRELRTYAIPLPNQEEEPGHLAQLARVAMNVIGIERRNLGNAILQRLGVADVEGWHDDDIDFEGYPLWKKYAPIPADPNRPPVRDAAPRAEVPAG